ncbi:MAG: hypothetical protein JW750_02490, partial [Anaerolineaceae bacterium]|nr:hypothetical protein [Anaerolineaceae bacterium]
LIARNTSYSDEIRQARLDESFIQMDWLLTDTQVERTWDTLGAGVAQYRLHSAFELLVQALFAYNRRWRTWQSRELTDLLRLAWLPNGFNEQLLLLTNALSETKAGYLERAKALNDCFEQVVAICQADGLYGENAISEAFIRQNNEPGRSWNMNEWNKNHRNRKSGQPSNS